MMVRLPRFNISTIASVPACCLFIMAAAAAGDDNVEAEKSDPVKEAVTAEAEAQAVAEAAKAAEAARRKMDKLQGITAQERLKIEKAKMQALQDVKAQAKANADGEDSELTQPQIVFLNQLNTLLKVELSFLNRVAELDEEQLVTAIRLGKEFTESKARKIGGGNQPPIANGFRRGPVPPPRTPTPSRSEVESELRKLWQQILTPKQQTAFEKECQLVDSFERQTLVDSIVTVLDSRLAFTQQQREDLSAELMKVDPNTLPSVDRMPNYGRYLPQIRQKEVLAIFTDAQRDAYDSIRKVNYGRSTTFRLSETYIIDDIDIDP